MGTDWGNSLPEALQKEAMLEICAVTVSRPCLVFLSGSVHPWSFLRHQMLWRGYRAWLLCHVSVRRRLLPLWALRNHPSQETCCWGEHCGIWYLVWSNLQEPHFNSQLHSHLSWAQSVVLLHSLLPWTISGLELIADVI